MAITNKELADLLGTVTVGADHTETLNAAYQKAFGRDADAEGLAYWSDRLDNGLDAETELMEALLGGAAKYPADGTYAADNAADKTVVANKSEVAEAILANAAVTTEQAETILATVTTDASKTTALDDVAAIVSGETFVLTASDDDTFVGTEKNDLFDASTKGTLQKGDVILDSTSTDNDILNATVTTATVDARVQNVETMNITGEYVTTGFKLTNVTGTTDLNVNSKLAGGTAKVTDANSFAVENINAGSNIGSLEVTSLTSGTRDNVNVDAGSADVELTGQAGGADKYTVTIAADKTLTVTEDTMNSAGDALTVNASGDLTLDTDQGGANANTELALTLTNNATDSITVDLDADVNVAKTLQLSGNDIVVDVDDGLSLGGTALTTGGVEVSSDAASSTLKFTATLGASDFFNQAQVDYIVADADLGNGASLTVNEITRVVLDKDQTALTLNIDNVDGDIASAGTLLLDVNADQSTIAAGSTITAGDKIETLFVTAGALEADSDGNDQHVVIKEIVTDSATDTVVFAGANDVEITTLTATDGDETFVASSLTGDLTISAISDAATVYGGSGNDSITTNAAAIFDVKAGAGDDTIDLTSATAGTKAEGGTGNDTITTSGTGDVIDAGAGDDKVTLTAVANSADTVTLGAGADTVTMEVTANNSGHTIKDFVAGEDTLVLTGTGAGALDLTKLTVSTNTYTVGTAITIDLTNNTAKDLSDSIQLGNATTAYTADSGVAVTAGDKDDVIAVDGANDITTGAGEDTVVVATGEATATVTDFTVGSDKVVLTGASGDQVTIDLSKVTVASGELTLTAVNHVITLNNGTDAVLEDGTTDQDASTMVQLGQDGAEFIAHANTTDITGGTFDDYIDLNAGNATVTVNFINNGGMDTISGFNSTDDHLAFGAIDGIVAGQEGKAITKATKATSGDVYVMTADTSIAGDTIDYSELGNTINNEKVTLTSASVMEDVVAYLNNALTDVAANHTYAAVINDDNGNDAYAYLINATSETITVDDVQLIGTIAADADLVAGDIA